MRFLVKSASCLSFFKWRPVLFKVVLQFIPFVCLFCPFQLSISTPVYFSVSIDDDSSRMEATSTQDHDPTESTFFDLQPPVPSANQVKIENVMRQLFSEEHLHFIIGDHILFYRFSSFLNCYKSHLVPTLIRYLEMRKAVKAIEYANAVARGVRWPSHTDYCNFSRLQAASMDIRFEDYAARKLLLLCTEALPAFIAHTLVGVVTDCVEKDITGKGNPVLQDLVGNLTEVYCLTDPSVHDNPIIFTSEGSALTKSLCSTEAYPLLQNSTGLLTLERLTQSIEIAGFFKVQQQTRTAP